MTRPKAARWALLATGALFPVLLSGCVVVQEIRLDLDESQKGVLSGYATGPVSKDDPKVGSAIFPMTSLAGSETYKNFRAASERLTNCGITPRIYQQRTRIRLDLRASFEDLEDANSILRCGAHYLESPAITASRRNGFFWDTHVTRFRIGQRTARCPPEGICNPAFMLPRAITLSVPGTIDRVSTDNSDLVGFIAEPQDAENDTVSISVAQASDYAAANRRFFAARRQNMRRDTIDIEITSSQAHFDLNTIISVVGLIFGSGLLLQLGRRFLFHKEDAPGPKPRRGRAKPSGAQPGRGSAPPAG